MHKSLTVVLLSIGIPAVEAENNALMPWGVTTYQCGLTRIVNTTVDIGSFEVQ